MTRKKLVKFMAKVSDQKPIPQYQYFLTCIGLGSSAPDLYHPVLRERKRMEELSERLSNVYDKLASLEADWRSTGGSKE